LTDPSREAMIRPGLPRFARKRLLNGGREGGNQISRA